MVKGLIGAFAVTGGIGERELADQYKAQGDDYNAIMIQAVADRLAEAFAEYLHEKVRKEIWGYASDEKLSNDELIRENIREFVRHPVTQRVLSILRKVPCGRCSRLKRRLACR